MCFLSFCRARKTESGNSENKKKKKNRELDDRQSSSTSGLPEGKLIGIKNL